MYKELKIHELLIIGDEDSRGYPPYSIIPLSTSKRKVNYTPLVGKFISKRILKTYLDNDSISIEDEEYIKELNIKVKYDEIISFDSHEERSPILIEPQSGIKLDLTTKTVAVEMSGGKLKGMYYQYERVFFKHLWHKEYPQY